MKLTTTESHSMIARKNCMNLVPSISCLQNQMWRQTTKLAASHSQVSRWWELFLTLFHHANILEKYTKCNLKRSVCAVLILVATTEWKTECIFGEFEHYNTHFTKKWKIKERRMWCLCVCCAVSVYGTICMHDREVMKLASTQNRAIASARP